MTAGIPKGHGDGAEEFTNLAGGKVVKSGSRTLETRVLLDV
jgi:hypothetical protein